MKAILEFSLPEEAAEHRLALDGGKWMSVCHELDQWFRSTQKHGDLKTLKVDEIRKRLYEELDSAGVSFD